MSSPPPRKCAACGRPIATSEVYYRFTLVLQGEQDVLDTSRTGSTEELSSLLRQLEEDSADARELEEQVHWERAGVICATCRALVVRTLQRPQDDAGPH